MDLFFALFYSVLGITLSIPYCLLAGWSWEQWPLVAFVAPAFAFVWLSLGTFAGHIYRNRGGRWPIGFSWRSERMRVLPGSQGGFYGWTIYCLLPIILHWGAKMVAILGFQNVASVLNEHRYLSLIYVLYGTMALVCIMAMSVATWGAMRDGWARLKQIVHR